LKVNAGTASPDRALSATDGICFEEQPMSSLSYRSSRPDGWIQPRPHQDASLRYMKHGPIQPMHEPGFLARLLGRY
jgi:hypothetical protein